jgi:hypothetical protein
MFTDVLVTRSGASEPDEETVGEGDETEGSGSWGGGGSWRFCASLDGEARECRWGDRGGRSEGPEFMRSYKCHEGGSRARLCNGCAR